MPSAACSPRCSKSSSVRTIVLWPGAAGGEGRPLAPLVNAGMAVVQLFAGDIEGSIAQARHTLTIEPGFFIALQELTFALELLGRGEEALDYLEPVLVALGFPAAAIERLRRGWREGGLRGYWDAGSPSFRSSRPAATCRRKCFIYLYAKVGDIERALTWAERLYQIDSGILVFLGVDPCIDELRHDPRFRELLVRCGLPSPAPAPG